LTAARESGASKQNSHLREAPHRRFFVLAAAAAAAHRERARAGGACARTHTRTHLTTRDAGRACNFRLLCSTYATSWRGGSCDSDAQPGAAAAAAAATLPSLCSLPIGGVSGGSCSGSKKSRALVVVALFRGRASKLAAN
jgi:hypothetical protein